MTFDIDVSVWKYNTALNEIQTYANSTKFVSVNPSIRIVFFFCIVENENLKFENEYVTMKKKYLHIFSLVYYECSIIFLFFIIQENLC